MKKVFDVCSKEYDEWYERNKFVYLSEIEALKRLVPKNGKGLEIGVGTGRFAKPLKISVGIDPSKNMLKIAESRGVKVFPGTGENLNFKNKEFDYVLLVITLCFVDNPDKVIAESKRVLKTRGKLIVGIVDKDSHLGALYLDKKRQGKTFYKEVTEFYSTKEVIALLKKHGFKNIVSFQTIFRPYKEVREVENPKKGYGEGGFVVICGKKN